MTAPEPHPAGDIAGMPRDLQIINLLSRLNTALAPEGELFKRLDHADELAHTLQQDMGTRTAQLLEQYDSMARALAEQAGILGRIDSMLEDFGPLLERAKAMTNPGSVASAWVKGSRRGARHRGQPE